MLNDRSGLSIYYMSQGKIRLYIQGEKVNDLTFQTWLTIVGPIVGLIFGQSVFLYRKSERNEDHWAESQRQWIDTQGKIYALMSQMNMLYVDPNAPKKTLEK